MIPGCIIDTPSVDLDVEVQVDKLIRAETKSSFRVMGGGKTRSFEEMRRLLLLREGVFVLSTFILCIES